jgi:hypothetical protein
LLKTEEETMKLKKSITVMMLFLIVVLAACGNDDTEKETSQTKDETTDIKELVQDYSTGKKEASSASITGKELIVSSSEGKEKAYKLPKDEFFVSIAPFVNETHPCTFHSLTGCQGEMVEKEFDVHIKDEKGNVVVDKKLKSQANGFIDLWVPRDKKYNITITHDGRKVKSEFSTFEEDPTCLTNMQLT